MIAVVRNRRAKITGVKAFAMPDCRVLHAAMDRAVLDAHGWRDVQRGFPNAGWQVR